MKSHPEFVNMSKQVGPVVEEEELALNLNLELEEQGATATVSEYERIYSRRPVQMFDEDMSLPSTSQGSSQSDTGLPSLPFLSQFKLETDD